MNLIQLQAMLWLRWRLSLNQWRRGGGINAVIMMIVFVVGLGLALAGGVGGFAGGLLGLAKASPQVIMGVWDGLVLFFLLYWGLGLVLELQRSEIIDMSRLLHLPVKLRDAFLLNYLASHLSFSLALFLPAMLGLAAGLALGRGAAMALLFPLLAAFMFMVTAWTYCLRSWLATLMVNKRRRRAIIMGVTVAFVILAQLPNLVTNVWFGGRRGQPSQMAQRMASGEVLVDLSNRYLPILWPAQGARTLAEGRVFPAVGCALGLLAIGAWGLARAYRSTVNFYRGGAAGQSSLAASGGPAVAASAAAPRVEPGGKIDAGKIFVERVLPVVPGQAGAVALASLRSMSRAPEIKMALAMNFIIFMVLGAGFLFRRGGGLPPTIKPFLISGAVVMTFLGGLAQVMCNHFGFDRNGFQSYVLMPAPRRFILLGKNLALLPVAFTMFFIYLVLATAISRPGLLAVLAAVFDFGFAFLALSALGNLVSILNPYRIAPGTLKPTKTNSLTQLLMVVIQMLLMAALLPIFLPAALGLLVSDWGWLPGAAVMLFCAMLMAGLGGLCYWLTLGPLGALMQRREQKIHQTVRQEVE